MRVVFVALGQEQLGISILSAVLKDAGHETALVFDPALFHDRYYFDVPVLRDLFSRDDETVEEVVASEPDLVAFSVLTCTYEWSLEIARRVKERIDVPVIFGGVHPSAVPDRCLAEPAVDYVCVGEGELALVSLCDELESGHARPRCEIGNLRWKRPDGQVVRGPNAPFIQDLDALPLADKSLWDEVVRHRDNYMTMTARGCPYRCTFCFNNYFARLPDGAPGKYVRQRSVDNVLWELRTMQARYGFQHVGFEDDIFTLDKRWMREFLRRYAREIGVPFSCLVHPRFIDREVAGWLKDAGCDRVQMGIQSADDEYKRAQLLRMERGAHVERALEAMSAVGLRMKLDHMLGLPGEPREAQDQALDLFRRYPPARINTYWLSYLPGTEMLDRAVDDGSVSASDLTRIERGQDRMFHHMNHAERGGDTTYYQRFELLFRLFPLVPARLRPHLRPSLVPRLPDAALGALGMGCDVAAALVQRDREVWVYARHYAHHLAALGRRWLSPGRHLARPPASPRAASRPEQAGDAPRLGDRLAGCA